MHADRAATASRRAARRRFPPIFLTIHAAEIRDKLNMVCRGHVRIRRCGRRPLGQSRAPGALSSRERRCRRGRRHSFRRVPRTRLGSFENVQSTELEHFVPDEVAALRGCHDCEVLLTNLHSDLANLYNKFANNGSQL